MPNRFLHTVLLIVSMFFCAFGNAQSICESSRNGQLVITSKSVLQLDEICACRELTSLWFKKVLVLSLPDCLASLQSLTSLSFSKAKLSRIPEEVFKLKKLQYLNLSHTDLYVLPNEIADLDKLVSLDLKYTFVETLPEGLGHLKTIDMRYIEMTQDNQRALRKQYPDIDIYFSSPCNCK